MSDVTPESVAERSFLTSFRGFQRDEVRAFLAEVAAELRRLEADRLQLAQRVDTLAGADLEEDIDRATSQINELLQQARAIAEDMRSRAAGETEALLADARGRARSEIESASTDAVALRRDAWETSSEMLAQCAAVATRTREEAQREAVQLVGEAEREAHRIQVAARREREEAIRAARLEAERMTAEARNRHDEILEAALKQSEAAQERTRALEHRRNQLMAELDRLRSGIADVPETPDLEPPPTSSPPSPQPAPARPAPSAAPSPPVHPEPATASEAAPSGPEEAEGDWEPGETVRVVHPSSAPVEIEVSTGVLDDPDIRLISADELALRRTGDTGETPIIEPASDLPPAVMPESSSPAQTVPPPPPAPAGDDGPEMEHSEPSSEPQQPSEPEPEPEVDVPVDVPVGSPAGVEADAEEDAGTGVLSEVASLFDRLRHEGSEEPPRSDPDEALPVDEAKSAAEAGAPTEAATAASTGAPTAASTGGGDPPMRIVDLDVFSLRDRLLLPVTNRGLRAVKKHLVEEQNLALEELRLDAEGWGAPADRLRERLDADLTTLMSESIEAGHQAAEALVGEDLPAPTTDPATGTGDFVDALIGDLAQTLAEGRAAGQGDRELSAGVSKVFRIWRTDQAERRLRMLALGLYHSGVVAAMRSAGHDSLAWRVAGRGCATCREHGAERSTSAVPPVHPNCECTLAPLVAVR